MSSEPLSPQEKRSFRASFEEAASAKELLDKLLTPEELADYLGVPLSTVYGWRTRGRRAGPRGIRVGRFVRYRQSDVDAWLERKAGAGPQAGPDTLSSLATTATTTGVGDGIVPEGRGRVVPMPHDEESEEFHPEPPIVDPDGFDDVYRAFDIGLVCARCGALVPFGMEPVHSNHHATEKAIIDEMNNLVRFVVEKLKWDIHGLGPKSSN